MRTLTLMFLSLWLSACAGEPSKTIRPPNDSMPAMHDFAARYTAAWCSQDPARVAACYAEDASLTINGGEPSVGREALTAAAAGFMDAFPDMVVSMDALEQRGDGHVYRWRLIGTNSGPGGTGRRVDIRGREEWTIDADGLIARSRGHFDEADYRRQLAGE